ncbi:hypothetical protein BLOT_014806 [Blomia tropicalis]|nr:hypothetical protein BLOT_014806 [Blomia tropicalis]
MEPAGKRDLARTRSTTIAKPTGASIIRNFGLRLDKFCANKSISCQTKVEPDESTSNNCPMNGGYRVDNLSLP